jgi:class 3 adenylate cyclase
VLLTDVLSDAFCSDTGDLRIRVGIHSGPVTVGVLKGAKAQFQLFGDTMDMAARMEHNSMPNRIMCSETTANLIRQAGKEYWICPREDKVLVKGKGKVQTYWLVLRDYVTTIASMYRFEHASHVTMSTNKLLKHLILRDASNEVNAMDLHNYAY